MEVQMMVMGPSLKMKRKMIFLLVAVFAVGFIVLIGRLVKLQIFDSSYYAQKALKQQLSTATISPNRGTIFDRNMKPLAESATVWDVIASPSYIKAATTLKTEAMRNSIADNLSKLLGMDRQTIYNILIRNSSYEIIKKKIEKPTADLVKQYLKDNNIDGVGLIPDSKRYYPFGNFASQLLGFTGTDNQGLSGVESQYDSVLEGVPGRIVTAKNANGTDMPYDYSDYIPADDGDNVVLTIDETVQYSLENNLAKAVADNKVTNKATAIVMNVNSGEILAMATTGGFDPNSPLDIYDQTVKQQLTTLTGDSLKTAKNVAQQTQWRNKSISDPYEPGSVFKVITASAGLDVGVVNENSQFNDPGSIAVDDRTFHCWKAGGHGNQTFLQGFENSCNVVFINVGLRIGSPNFFKYFSNFGLTAKTGIDLPGEATSIYLKEKDLTKVSLASCSFGQSDKETPIELITAVAASANGGYLVQPHVVKEETDQNGNVIKTFGTTVKRQVISAETSKELDHLLEMEVNEGSGKNAYVAGYRIGGKTGTSQKLDPSSNQNARIASFVGVAPCDNPQIALLLILDEPHNPVSNYGGVIAAPVAGTIFSEILPYLGVQPIYTDAELEKLDVKIPDLANKNLTDATNTLKSWGLKIKPFGTGQTITGQMPAAGESMPKDGTVIVYTGGAQVVQCDVPNLNGLTPEQVNSTLAAANLNEKLVGIAQDDTGETAYEQDYAEGTKVNPGTVITVKFRSTQVQDDLG
jgi:stage V sporulation protein D (sporulation-specific penicillin-binding protein)